MQKKSVEKVTDMKAAVKTTEQKAAAKLEAPVAKVEETKAMVKAESTKAVEKVAEKATAKVEETKAAVKTVAKKAAAKKPAAKKTTAKKTEKTVLVPEVYVQYTGQEAVINDVVTRAKEAFAADGHRTTSIKSLQVYLKPEESTAYYVVNQKYAGKVNLF